MDNRVDLPKIKNFRKSHSRTKWGGVREGIGKPELETTWYCQICGVEQPLTIDPYLFEVFYNEHLRICPDCYNFFKQGFDDMKQIREMSMDLHKLIIKDLIG